VLIGSFPGRIQCKIRPLKGGEGGFPPSCAPSGQQEPFGYHKIGQREESFKLSRVFRYPSVSHFPVAKEVLNNMEGMFDHRADLRF